MTTNAGMQSCSPDRGVSQPEGSDIRGDKELQLNQHTLSMRLERVAAHVPAGARLADIGSDHG